MILLRDVRLCEQHLPRAQRSLMSHDLPGHEERLKAHEERIHNHPCGCGSGKRYVDCCIDKINQEYIELRHRRRMRERRRRQQAAAKAGPAAVEVVP